MDAPPPIAPSRSMSRLPVLGLGLATTAAALFGVWSINQATDSFNIMGFYYFYIFPAGALIVGMVAGCGYGIGSWWTGVRISRGLLWTVVLLQFVAYFAAQYIEYLYLIEKFSEEIGFFEFFDVITQSFTFKEDDGGGGSPMGAWGYAFRLLEIGGFVLGGLAAPLILRSKSYCEQCQVYMRSKTLVLLPAGAEVKKIKRKDTEGRAAYEKENEEAFEAGMSLLEQLRQHGEAGRADEFAKIIEDHSSHSKAINKLTTRVAVSLDACRICHQGLMRVFQVSGQGNNIQRTNLGHSPVTPGLLHDLKARNLA